MSDRRADERAESAVLERSKARESNRLPRIGDDGIPYCSYEACAQYDGKRCRLLGVRPDSFCAPQIVDMAREIAAYRAHYVTKKSADLALHATASSIPWISDAPRAPTHRHHDAGCTLPDDEHPICPVPVKGT